MSAPALASSTPAGGRLDPPVLDGIGRRWSVWLGPLVSLAILALVLRGIGSHPIRLGVADLPRGPLFWIAFLLYGFSTPLSDWLIYRRLWSIPSSGIIALLRKHVLNHLTFGYLGEFYFYGWARQNGRLAAAPFGAIKDVAILSAVCGNVVALATLPAEAGVIRYFMANHDPWLLGASLLAFSATTLLPLLFGRLIFSLPPGELSFVAIVQLLRAVVGIGLYAGMWHLLLPGESYLLWLMLAAMRQIVTRLPFVPDDEVVFTAVAVFFVGHETVVAGMLGLLAGMSMLLLLVLGFLLGVWGLLTEKGI